MVRVTRTRRRPFLRTVSAAALLTSRRRRPRLRWLVERPALRFAAADYAPATQAAAHFGHDRPLPRSHAIVEVYYDPVVRLSQPMSQRRIGVEPAVMPPVAVALEEGQPRL